MVSDSLHRPVIGFRAVFDQRSVWIVDNHHVRYRDRWAARVLGAEKKPPGNATTECARR